MNRSVARWWTRTPRKSDRPRRVARTASRMFGDAHSHPAVNNVKNDGPECLEPVEEPKEAAGLFG
jgi:putative SOS response-associated peptidase YedK